VRVLEAIGLHLDEEVLDKVGNLVAVAVAVFAFAEIACIADLAWSSLEISLVPFQVDLDHKMTIATS
jgi:hypothetical protein